MALKFQQLTRNAIKDLKTGKRINEHGISVERTKTGDIRYSVNIMVDGQRIHRVIGKESEGVTRSHAENQIKKYSTEAREGRLDLPQGRKTHKLFKEAAGVRSIVHRAFIASAPVRHRTTMEGKTSAKRNTDSSGQGH